MQKVSRLRFIFVGLIFVAIAIVASNALETGAADEAVSQLKVNVHSSDDSGMQFTLSLPTAEVSSDGAVAVSGLESRFTEPGQPDLPFYTTIIALPPEADADVTINVSDESERAIDAIRPIPTSKIDEMADIDNITSIESYGFDQIPDPAIYENDGLFPNQLWEVSEPMYIRDLRVVKLTIYPVRYNPVGQTLTEAEQIDVNISFSGTSRAARNPAAGSAEFGRSALNYDTAENWRSLPTDMNSRATSFPIGVETLKITVNKDGIYEITYDDIVNAGMNVASLNTSTLQLMHQNAAVAYQLIEVGASNNTFDAGEAIRFYGWAFDGDRHDRLFVGDNNVYFLYSGGTPTKVNSIASSSSGTPVNTWRSTINYEQDKFFTTTDSTKWDSSVSDNEPEAWYWFGLKNGITKTVTIDVPDPVSSGAAPSLLVEVSNTNVKDNHLVDVSLNNSLLQTFTWSYNRNKNLIHNGLAASALLTGTNTVDLWSHRLNTGGNFDFDDILVNRLTLTYDRELNALSNELAFNYTTAGPQRFQVSGFTINDPTMLMVWDVSSKNTPTVIMLDASDISGPAGDYTANIGLTTTNDSHIIATTNVHTPAALSTYTATSLEPAGGNADWLAIAHNTLLGESTRLATHRNDFSGLSTHVVDVNDVYNQYGYGQPLPSAVKSFLSHGLSNWGLSYVVMVGDATENPRKLTCSLEEDLNYTECSPVWNNTDESYVLTDFQFKDRFKGMIATDHTFATLIGSDEIEDIAIGRIAAHTSTDLKNINDKIIAFENAVQFGDSYTNNMLWLADDDDAGGNFCSENADVRNNNVTEQLTHKELCLVDSSPNGLATLRGHFFNYLGTQGARIINYRGHGSASRWAGTLVTSDHASEWLNAGQPGVILSADCLDGDFSKSGEKTLGETFMKLDLSRGSAAHWSSSGLGFSAEHTVLHRGFYDGLYEEDYARIGDVIMYAKNNYIAVNGGDISEPYSFILQADPAMIMKSTLKHVYLPIIIK